MVYRMQLTHNEIVDMLDVKLIAESTLGYTIPPRINEIHDNTLIIKSLLPNKVKITITIADIRLKSHLTTDKTIRFTENSFFYTFLGFIHSRPLGVIEGFIQQIPGLYKAKDRIRLLELIKLI